MATDIFLDPVTNDIQLDDNKIMRLTANRQESSRQQVQISLSTFRGEWFVNTLAGIPYIANDFNNIQLMGISRKSLFDISIKEDILARENIVRLESYNSVFDRRARTLTVDFIAITETGEVIPVENLEIET